MANKVEKIVKLKAKEFNKKRSFLLPKNVKCRFLTKDGETGGYNEIYVLDNWYHEFVDLRNQTRVNVATLDELFESQLLVASDLEIETIVYEINKRDVLPPDGNRAFWQVFCTKTEFTFISSGDPVPIGTGLFWEEVEW